MSKFKGDDTMLDLAVLAVPCDRAFVVSQEMGESILEQLRNNKLSKEKKEEISQKAKDFRRKPIR